MNRALLQSTVRALLTSNDLGATLVESVPAGATLMTLDGVRVVVADADDPQLMARLPALARERLAHQALIVVGGDQRSSARALKRAVPSFVLTGLIELYVVQSAGGDDVRVHAIRRARGSRVGAALEQQALSPPVDDEAFAAELAPILKEREPAFVAAQARLQEARAFAAAQQQIRPLATWTLVGACCAMYAVTLALGGPESVPALMRLGANSHERTFDEPWRLVSSIFLHGGAMHLVLNMYCLAVLGPFLERLLGWRRYLVLFAASGVGASALSATFSDAALSVGASGAIWGIMGAAAALAWRPRGLVPDAIVPGLKRAATTNLAVNIANSLRPDVDWLAHLGGGVVGAALVGFGVIVALEPARRAAILNALAGVAGAALALGLIVPFAASDPLRLLEGARMVKVALPRALGAVELPSYGASAEWTTGDGTEEGQLGVLRMDPVFTTVIISPPFDTDPSPEALPAARDELVEAAETFQPEGFKPTGSLTKVSAGPYPGLERAFVTDTGVELGRVWIVTGNRLVVVDVFALPPVREHALELARRAAATLVMTPTPSPPASSSAGAPDPQGAAPSP